MTVRIKIVKLTAEQDRYHRGRWASYVVRSGSLVRSPLSRHASQREAFDAALGWLKRPDWSVRVWEGDYA